MRKQIHSCQRVRISQGQNNSRLPCAQLRGSNQLPTSRPGARKWGGKGMSGQARRWLQARPSGSGVGVCKLRAWHWDSGDRCEFVQAQGIWSRDTLPLSVLWVLWRHREASSLGEKKKSTKHLEHPKAWLIRALALLKISLFPVPSPH